MSANIFGWTNNEVKPARVFNKPKQRTTVDISTIRGNFTIRDIKDPNWSHIHITFQMIHTDVRDVKHTTYKTMSLARACLGTYVMTEKPPITCYEWEKVVFYAQLNLIECDNTSVKLNADRMGYKYNKHFTDRGLSLKSITII